MNGVPPPGEGKAQISLIDLPSELEAGAFITGLIKIKNIGEATDDLRLLVIPEWTDVQYGRDAQVAVGGTLAVSIIEGLLVMPDKDAIIVMKGQHLEDGVWITDDEKSH